MSKNYDNDSEWEWLDDNDDDDSYDDWANDDDYYQWEDNSDWDDDYYPNPGPLQWLRGILSDLKFKIITLWHKLTGYDENSNIPF